jgi:NADPH2:quinone reductase
MSMKAIRVREFGGPEVLRLEELPDPQPAPDQIVVRIKAAGVNPVETYVRAGKYARLPQLPYTPGSDAGGVVEAVGAEVTGVKAGDRVYLYGSLTGTYAELALCTRNQVYPLPANATYGQGAAIGVPAATAWRAVFHRGKAQPAETVIVHGATGAVGMAAVQLAVAAGLTVIGTAGSERGKQLILEHGAHHALSHEESNDPATVRALTNGRGADLIIEMLANANLAKDLGVLAKYGRVVIVGSRGPIEIDPRMTMVNDADIRGMTLFNVMPEEMVAIHAALGAALANGTLRPVVSQEIPLAEAPRAHDAVMQSGIHGKIVLVP